MRDYRWVPAFVLLMISLAGRLSAQESAWHDPSSHTVQFIAVDNNVKLEVLDWGGSGRPLVLLAGLGNTAHVFDDFAPKLTSEFHVYGITRRGFGASSAPAEGYSATQLGNDVLAVIDALNLDRPVLVGHSVAGEELSSVGSRFPKRIAGLIYLDAAYSYAYYDHSEGDLNIDAHELQNRLEQLVSETGPPDRKVVQELLQEGLPQLEADLKRVQDNQGSDEPLPPPTADDLASFLALRSWFERRQGITFPEAEFREGYEARPNGSVGRWQVPPRVAPAIQAGKQKYTDIRVPVLAIYAIPHALAPSIGTNAATRAALDSKDASAAGAQADAFQAGVPSARVVRLPHANHYVFISNETDVLREMRTFLASLN